jgi:hypothetical protein
MLLAKHCIFIDDFKVRKDYYSGDKKPLWLLTHAHSDHAGKQIQRFNSVFCTAESGYILEIPKFNLIEPGKTYTHNGVKFSVFSTLHSPGSVGFYFYPPIHILYVGDSRIDNRLFSTVETLVRQKTTKNKLRIISDREDFKYRQEIKSFPTVAWSRKTLHTLWKKFPGKLVLAMHSDSLCLLLNNLFVPVPLPTSVGLPPVRPNVVRAMSLLPSGAPFSIYVCGRLPRHKIQTKDYIFVEPSLLYYVNNTVVTEPSVIECDVRGVWRMFASGHASLKETQKLKKLI